MRVLSSPNLLPDLAESAGFVVGRFATLISLNPLSPAGAGSYIPTFARWGGLLRCLTAISVFDGAASRFNSGAGTLGHGKTPGLYRLLNLA